MMETKDYVIESLKGKVMVIDAYLNNARWKLEKSLDQCERALNQGEIIALIKVKSLIEDGIKAWED